MENKTRNTLILTAVCLALSLYPLQNWFSAQIQTASQAEKTSQSEEEEDSFQKQVYAQADPGALKSVSAFFEALQQGNVEEAYSYASGDISDGLAIQSLWSQFQSGLDGQSDQVASQASAYYLNSISQSVRKFSVQSSVQDGETSAFLVQITAADMDQFVMPDMQDSADQVNEWVDSHIEELSEMASQNGQEEVQSFLEGMQAEIYYESLTKQIESLPDCSYKLQVLVRQNGLEYEIFQIDRQT